MAKSKTKVQMPSGIRNKLMAAMSMLLVSCIMLISSTYAWFTLSTAPEVTGIDTTVAGNGSLEIALMPTNGMLGSITTGRGSNNTVAANTTWGNIINLSNESYGLSKVNLNPATLNQDADGALVTEHLLTVAAYGYDGRVEKLDGAVTVTRSYDKDDRVFKGENLYGVRAIGDLTTDATKLNTTYGYVVDLAVRLNTTNDDGTAGKLLLQTEKAQRIYAEGANAETLGGGSYMSFSDTTGLNVMDLMKAVRVTFVQNLGNAASGNVAEGNTIVPTILGTAKLDTTEDQMITLEDGSGYSAKLYLMDKNNSNNLIKTQTNAVLINSLTKNAATQISAIVWLDGSAVKNSSVSAVNTALAQATLNLQFATDVTLNPAVNSALRGDVPSDQP